MPPLPDAAQVLKVQLGWADDSDVHTMNVLHFSYSGGPPTSAQCATMAATIAGHQFTRFASFLNVDSQTAQCNVTDLTSPTSGQGAGGGGSVGTRAGDELAAGTCMVVSKQIARRFRGGHARTYLPFGVGGDISGGIWDGGLVGSVNTAWGNFINDVLSSGSGCTISSEILLSYVSGGAPRVTPRQDNIIAHHIGTLVGSQRRRNRRQ